ncbi:MAG: outer membrane lipoprotein-sorting protein [Burkholderiaceae bacterium]
MHRIRIMLALVISFFALQTPSAMAALSAAEIVDRAEDLLWGKTAVGDFEMTITTPTWSRTLSLKVWMDRPKQSFLRIATPAKDAGISSLRIDSEMWNYIPAIERTIKIPPSLMLQPWLGSDFTNDDLVKESSIVTDYTHRLIGEKKIDGNDAYQIEGLPKPNAAVVWGKIVYSIRKSDFVPLKLEYYDERGDLIRALNYSDIRTVDGRSIPTRWEMQPLTKPGKKTTIVVKSLMYNRPINADIFSLRNLKQKG